MNIKKLVLLALFASLGFAVEAKADGLIAGYDASYSSSVSGSSATIAGPLRVITIWLSTGNQRDYAVLYDSGAQTGIVESAFQDEHRKTPAMVFTSSAVATAAAGLATPGTIFRPNGEYGVRFQSGCVVVKSAASSGEANRMIIYYRLD